MNSTSKVNLKEFFNDVRYEREVFKRDDDLKLMKKRMKDKLIHDSPIFE